MLKKFGLIICSVWMFCVPSLSFAQDEDSLTENKALVEQLYEMLNAHDLESFGEVAATPQLARGFRADYAAMFAAFPDASFSIEQLIAEGDLVMARVTITGTHSGRFLGIAATDVPVEFSTMNLYRLEDGKIAETWQTTGLELMIELGVITPD